MDLIKILLQAEISKDAVNNIQKQIKKISDTTEGIKIKVDIDDKALKNIESINKKIQNQIGSTKAPAAAADIDNSVGQLDKLIQKTDRSTGNLLNVIKYITLTNSESLKIVDFYDKKTGELIDTTDELTISYKKQRQELEKLEQLQSKSLWGISKEKLDNIGKRSDAIKQLNKHYKEQADLAEKISLFKQKMLGGDGISGELDIFAYTHKGKYDKSAFNQIKDSIESISLQTPDAASKIKQLNTQWGTFKKTVSESSNIFTRTMENMGKFLRFYLAGGLLVGFVRDIKKGIDFIKELDKDLTQISIITGMTKDETLKLAQSYGELGKEIGKTVTEISKVNTELVRQGLSLEESQSRMDTILKLSATGAISTDQSLKIITSAVNALGEESERTADVMLKSSQISASSVEEIGEAFTKTASSAKSTGMSLTELNAIISGLVETTQESPRSLGNSVKTLLGRFNRINEETGEINESLNDVQEAFESVGISFLDSEKQIRPVYELLTDLDKVWGDLDKNTKMYIATQAAGTRQQNRFLAIMNSFTRIQEINNELMESGGTLVEGYATYLNSVEAASNKAKASLENLWVNAINSETIRSFYLLSSTVMDAIDKIGLLKFTIAALSTALLLANKRWRSFSKNLVTGELFSATKQMSMFTNQVNALGISFD
ncbi:MAG TPA: phage tail tape measure protein, partial [Bacteroidales bacterium]|nr:phage tail tape measure protein [Bacteroidales bacterium]